MSVSLRNTLKDPALRASALAIFFFGTTGAATSPYQSIIGIQELGLSDSGYAVLMFSAAAINVTASVLMGILADRMGDYRTSILYISLFGVAGFGLVYLAASVPAFVASKLILLPIYGALNSLIFAYIRASSTGQTAARLIAINSTMRATLSLSWVLMPGIVGVMLAGASSILPAYLVATIAAIACFLLAAFQFPKPQVQPERRTEERYRFLASLREVFETRVMLRILAIALICSMLHINDAILPLIVTGQAGGTVGDVGIIIGIVALLEIIFIIVWGRAERWLTAVRALAIGAGLYALYLLLQGFVSTTWHVYAQTILSGIAAAAIISLPITYLQDLIADRPGLGSSLIAVNIFLSAGLSAVIFAVGTAIGSYGLVAILGALVGSAGIALLLVLDGTRRRTV
ncbi:MFS transporter [Rhizobium sp. SAFR-030]|uniref:MFS transporter n=1 Tax=Rhizobium sp. SAFR-030 TaxID=3387277 RepID=UPI003F80ED1F